MAQASMGQLGRFDTEHPADRFSLGNAIFLRGSIAGASASFEMLDALSSCASFTEELPLLVTDAGWPKKGC